MKLGLMVLKTAIAYPRKYASLCLFYDYSNIFRKHRLIFVIGHHKLTANMPDSWKTTILEALW
jgi:hypothetical protein